MHLDHGFESSNRKQAECVILLLLIGGSSASVNLRGPCARVMFRTSRCVSVLTSVEVVLD